MKRAGRSYFFLFTAIALASAVSCSDDNNGTDGGRDGGGGAGGRIDGGAGSDGSSDSGAVGGSDGGGAGGGTAGTGGTGGTAALRDGQLLGIALEANTGEVRTAEIANVRTTTPAVLTFAGHLSTDHGMANARLQAIAQASLIVAEDSAQRRSVATQGTQIGEALWMQPIASFDATFLQAQVTLHTAVLQLLDTTLIPAATKVELKTELQTERITVAAHLAEAQGLLGAGNTDGGDAGLSDGGGDGVDGAGDGAGDGAVDVAAGQ